MAQRANAGTLSATGGLFINDIHTRWSLRVAVGGDADSSLEGQTRLTFFFFFAVLPLKKSRDVFFFPSTETFLTGNRKYLK